MSLVNYIYTFYSVFFILFISCFEFYSKSCFLNPLIFLTLLFGSSTAISNPDEKSRILSVISEIEQKKLESFMKTLSDINAIFTKVFNSITKGKAELVPEDPNDVFSSGLDIAVELPNKRVRNIRGLSGGELSVLAISLIMALSKYTDAVFYVLDEVDAALDAINAGNFSALVKAYSVSSQFIIISHNETTLINADVIYGVTMNDEGISRVVSVKMPEQKAQ